MITIKKAKNNYVYDIKGGKSLDFSRNTNISGYSNKKITTPVKNALSSSWNVTGNTLYHKRFKNLIKSRFGSDYILLSSQSRNEFFILLSHFYKDLAISFVGKRIKAYFENKKLPLNFSKESKKNIFVYDMAEFYLENAKIDIDRDSLNVVDYFFYPEFNIETYGADIIILPEIYSGNFNYINILVKKNLTGANYFSNPFENIPALYVVSSLKSYFIAMNIFNNNAFKLPVIKNDFFLQRGRIFSPKSVDNYSEAMKNIKSDDIILNEEPPFYNYFSLTLEDYQIKKIGKIFNG
ncbi:MAG TPA: hypothetical protein PLO89_04380 [Spirochaetota bacterium]|nr:hypothetical protein [Spirochaetota bacterium]